MSTPYPIDGSRDALWMATAVPAPDTSSLSEVLDCDVAIVGAGLTGLNAALSLAENGCNVQVLEAAGIGFGASGRAGGQVNLGLNAGPSELQTLYGKAQGERTIELVVKTPDTVFSRVKRYALDCDPVQQGWVQAAATPRLFSKQRSVAADYAAHADVMQVLDAQSTADRTGSQGYVGGLFCPTAGSVQPLSYTRELARVAQAAGARIHTHSAVTGIEAVEGRWQISTASGQLRADKVLICTNGYSHEGLGSALKGYSKSVVPVRSVLVATEPLSDNVRKSVLPGGVTFVDKRRLILYARYDRDGRLCIGDHGPMRDAFAMGDFDAVKQRALTVFPQLKGVRWDYHWGGRIAVTQSGLPFIHEAAAGLVIGMGFNGRGVGAGTMMGLELAKYAMHGDRNALGFPVSEPRRFLMHRFHAVGASSAVKWFALMDYLDSLR